MCVFVCVCVCVCVCVLGACTGVEAGPRRQAGDLCQPCQLCVLGGGLVLHKEAGDPDNQRVCP